uniref:Protein kinase domain-containing protein n=1 Tax=Lates calcarifer TaxID=8187 RepID=A0A4W6CTQ3_LATCA
MSIGVATARSQLCLKRLLDEPQDKLLECKRARLAPPPPTPGLSPCLRPRSPTPKSSQMFNCGNCYHVTLTVWSPWLQVLPLRGYQEHLAAYARIGHHDNICGLQDVVIGQDSVYVFLPNHHGDMHAYVRNRKRLGEEEAGLLFTQMLNAVMHCHCHGVVLRDLKLRRFVFTDRYRTHLALLGLDDCVLLHGDHSDDSLTDRHGCPAYVGPELPDQWGRVLLGPRRRHLELGRVSVHHADWTIPVSGHAACRAVSPRSAGGPSACPTGCRSHLLRDWRASELLMHPWLTNPCAPHHSVHKTPSQLTLFC